MAGEAFGTDPREQEQQRRLAEEELEQEALDVLYAWVAFDPAHPEREGIMGIQGPTGPVPVVGTRYSVMEKMEPVMRRQLRGTGKGGRLVAFKRQAVISSFE